MCVCVPVYVPDSFIRSFAAESLTGDNIRSTGIVSMRVWRSRGGVDGKTAAELSFGSTSGNRVPDATNNYVRCGVGTLGKIVSAG